MKVQIKAMDGLRGLTAFYVLVHHARLGLTQSYGNGLSLYPEKYEWYDRLMVYCFGLFKFGHEAVIIFFVLSGFVIHLKQANQNYKFSDFKVLNYLKRRIIRIYPTLLVSFLLCILADYLIYLVTRQDLKIIFSKYHIANFMYNFFLIPDAPIWGYNFPVWSLKHEWFFYILYPLLFWLSKKHVLFPLLIVAGLFMSYAFGFRIPFIGPAAYTLLIWTLGSILAVIYQNRQSNIIKYIPFLILLCFVYPFVNKVNQNYLLQDIIFGLIAVGILTLIIDHKINFASHFLNRFAWLGTFSYSLYLLHMPLVNAYQSILLHFNAKHVLPYNLWHALLSVLIIVPTIYVIYYYTERLALNYKRKI